MRSRADYSELLKKLHRGEDLSPDDYRVIMERIEELLEQDEAGVEPEDELKQ